MSLMSINQRKRAASPFFAPKPPKSHLLTTPGGHISRVKDVDETPKSSVSGASFNLINSIVGAGIVGIPFAIQQCSLVLGLLMVNFFAAMTIKSLRLLIETAKHIDVASYERLAEASFGKLGFNIISYAMFIMSYGAMVGYLIIIKTNLSLLLGVEADNYEMSRAVLLVSTLCIILPLSSQRDMSSLSKTSTISVSFDCVLVMIVAIFSPVSESIDMAGGLKELILERSSPNLKTVFVGTGVLCFAFVCQHASFIIAASLENPTRARWNKVTLIALSACAFLASVMGLSGFMGFLDDTEGDIITNLGNAAMITSDETFQRAANIARGLICTTMFFVYPMELFVARHVCVVLLFKGRRAHEGDDHSVLARTDRRVGLTVLMYVISVVPALLFDDLGSVFSVSGSLGGATLSYIFPGACYLAVHGSEFIELVSKRWNYMPTKGIDTSVTPAKRRILHPSDIESCRKEQSSLPQKNIFIRLFDCILWYALFMPVWCKIAMYGKVMIKKHREDESMKSPMPYALGKIVHHSNKPQHGNLLRPIRIPPIDDSDHERKPLIRTFSSPQVDNFGNTTVAPMFDKTSRLPPLPPMRKAKVGFSLGANHSSANEKVQLDRTNPITPDSFSSASFEMARDSSYGSTGISISELVNEIKRDSIRSGVSDINSDQSVPDSDLDEGLSMDDENDDDRSHESSIFIREDDDVSHHSENSSIHASLSKKIDGRSIHRARQRVANPSQKIVDEIPRPPSLEEIKAHPSVKRRIAERGYVVSVATGGKDDEGEDDPQDDMPSVHDFVIAIGYILFGLLALFAGLYSSLLE